MNGFIKKHSRSLKRIIMAALAGVMLLSGVACGKDKESAGALNTKGGEKVESTDYQITFYWGPTEEEFTEAEIIRMKEAGFDTVPIQRFPWEHEKIKEVVQLLDKHGLKAAVREGWLVELMEGQQETTKEEVDAAVKKTVDYYKDCKNVTEWILYDEPSADKFERLGWAVEAFRKYSPDTETYINLLPNYAAAQQLGTANYQTYLNKFCETVKPDYLCVDHYAFIGSPATSSVRENFYQNLETVRTTGEKYGLETRFIMLVSKHAIYSDVTLGELRLQANLTLLFGMKGLSWFTYSHPGAGYELELVDKNGNTTAHYDYVKEVNPAARVLGDALYNTKSTGVYNLGIEEAYTLGLPKYDGKKYEGSKALVGEFENGYVMLLNGMLMDGGEAEITVDGLSSMQWLNPSTGAWDGITSCPYVVTRSGNTFISLRFSEGVLLRKA